MHIEGLRSSLLVVELKVAAGVDGAVTGQKQGLHARNKAHETGLCAKNRAWKTGLKQKKTGAVHAKQSM